MVHRPAQQRHLARRPACQASTRNSLRFGSGQALTDGQFRLLVPLIPPAKPGGQPRSTDMRDLLDGLFYLVRTGCQWRHLPPPPITQDSPQAPSAPAG